MKWAGHAPIKCFWVEHSGMFRASQHFKDGTRVAQNFKSKARANAFNEKAWNHRYDEVSSTGIERLYRYGGRDDLSDDELPPGAMWDAFYMHEMYPMPDGICLMVKLPNGGSWCVDSRASNCEIPFPGGREHRCWVREGDPRTGNVNITKGKPGESCNAGAGSIGWGRGDDPEYYHGFLRNGYLVPA